VKPSNGVHLVFGPFRFDSTSGLLFEEGVDVALPPRAATILTNLLETPGEMVSKEDLIDAVWGDTAVTDQSLTEAVKLLRHALGDDPKSPTYIHTLRGRGYRFIAEVSAVSKGVPMPKHAPITKDGPRPTDEARNSAIRAGPATSASERRRGRRILVGIAAVAIAALGGTFLVWTGLIQTTDQVAQLERRMDALGTGAFERVAWAGDAEFSGSPSPDGKYIAYVGSSGRPQLWLYETETGLKRQLTEPEPEHAVHRDGRAVFSPDGRKIAYVVWLMNANVFELRVLTLSPEYEPRQDVEAVVIHRGAWIVAHDWSPEGGSVLVARQSDAGLEIVLIPVPGGPSPPRDEDILTVLVGVEDASIDGPRKISMSPNGDAIAYDVAQGDGMGNRDIKTLSLNDGTETTIVDHPLNDHSPLWAPDGRRLVFVSNRQGLYGLYTVRIADRQEAGPAALNTRGLDWSVRLLGVPTFTLPRWSRGRSRLRESRSKSSRKSLARTSLRRGHPTVHTWPT